MNVTYHKLKCLDHIVFSNAESSAEVVELCMRCEDDCRYEVLVSGYSRGVRLSLLVL